MSMAAKFSSKLANIFSNDKKSNAQAQAQSNATELEVSQEKARKELLKLTKTARIGFPHRPICVAYDCVQRLVAIGTRQGLVKLYGGESIDYTLCHASTSSSSSSSCGGSQSFGTVPVVPSSSNSNSGTESPVPSGGAAAAYMTPPTLASFLPPAVLFMSFVINEGALITYCEDSTISFWNLRQKQPGVLFSKKLINEKGTAMYLPFQSNWLFIGTEKGNTYLLNIYNNFSQSGYDIKWNNVIELRQKNAPGRVVHLSDHPLEPSKILIGFDSGLIVLWNLKIKRPECHFYGTTETMSSIGWFYDGKQFMSAHNNGSLIVWSSKGDTKPLNIIHPHKNESDLIPKYNMIKKVYWESNKNGEPLTIFSDGLPSSDCGIRDAITIIKNNKHKTIIEMKERIIDFIVLSSSPWTTDNPTEPIGALVLLENNLVVIDLRTEGFPQFQHHHPTSIHESPLTANYYIIDPSKLFFRNLVASKEKYLYDQRQLQLTQLQQQRQNSPGQSGGVTASKQVYSPLNYPVTGGLKCTKSNVFGYAELMVTGHEDGSIKFWDTTGLGLTLLHKVKTQKLFDKRKFDTNNTSIDIDLPFKITALTYSKNFLAVAASGGHATLYKFASKTPTEEGLADIPLFEIPIEYSSDSKSPNEQITSNLPSDLVNKKELKCFLRTKIGFRRLQGFQPELVCLLYWSQRPPVVTNISIYTKTNLILFGTDESIVGVDYVNRTLLINVSLVDFYGTQDPFNRGHKSPKKNLKSNNNNDSDDIESAFINLQMQKQSAVDQKETVLKEKTTSSSRRFSLMHLKQKLENYATHHGVNANLVNVNISGSNVDTTDAESEKSDIKKDPVSRSSSCSSLENVSQSEGISCIAINDYAPTIVTNTKSDFQQQIFQIWLGTTYGSVIVLNAISQINSGSATTGSNCTAPGLNDSINQSSICPSGTVFQMKGQVLDVSFMDVNGCVVCSAISNAYEPAGLGASNADGSSAHANNEDDLNAALDIDFAYLTNANISNSIAENFYSSPKANQTNNPATNYLPSNGDLNNNSNNASNNNDNGNNENNSPSPYSANNNATAFMNSFNQTSNLTQSFDETKAPNKTNKKTLAATKSSKVEFGITQDRGCSVNVSDKSMFAVLTSELQIKVIGLPSQSCLYKCSIGEGTVAKASVVVVNFLSYLTCYLTNGNFLVYNLPNPTLKVNLQLNPPSLAYKEKELIDRAIRTFAFGGNGHAIYMCSPSEMQKVYLSTSNEGAINLSEMLSEFFDPKILTLSAPKPNLFKSLFSSTPFDREELFGESSGKPSISIIKSVDGEVGKAKKELTELQKLALERGEKLSQLDLKSEQLAMAASEYAKNAQALANKYKEKSKRFGF